MDREQWEEYRAAPEGPGKRKLRDKLLAGEEPLAQAYASRYASGSQYYTDNLKDDLLQASRVGLLRALDAWKPEKGAWSVCAFFWTRHEMQLVTRHASRITVPKSAFLPKKKQDEIAKFVAIHGREPAPEEVGLTAGVLERSRKAAVEIVHEQEADEVAAEDQPSPEVQIDRKRDTKALTEFIAKLSPKDRKEFWSGDRPDLTERARVYVEGKRGCRTKK